MQLERRTKAGKQHKEMPYKAIQLIKRYDFHLNGTDFSYTNLIFTPFFSPQNAQTLHFLLDSINRGKA